MQYRLLGPLEVIQNGLPVKISGPQQRELLALLLLDANRVISVDRLVDRLWSAKPPDTARSLLHGCISDLRRALRTGAEGRAQPLLTRAPGYLLRVWPGELDLDRVTELEVAAGRLADAGSRAALDRAAAVLAEALRLWRGPVLDGVDGAAGTAEAVRLGDRMLTLVERRADLDLRLGRFPEVAGELRARTQDHPLRETLWTRFVLALYGAGLQAEALAAYQEVRRILADQLGIGPGAGLRRLERAVLAQTDVADLVRDEAGKLPVAPAAPTAIRPAQLPAAVSALAGREQELDQLDEVLIIGAGPAVIAAVSGSAGVGKTALAGHWAHRRAEHFPDGQLYVDLRGFDPSGRPVEPATAVRGFLDALGVPATRIPVDPDAQAALYRSVLSGRRVLVLLDNARDTDQARPLLPGTRTAAVLVTSRNQLAGLVTVEGARSVGLDVLPAPAARDLLAGRLGPVRVAAEPEAVDRIVERCARLPLALAIVAARAATRPVTLATLATELAAAGDRLDVLDTGDSGSRLRAVFSCSYAALTPPAAALFRLVGVHPGPDLSATAAAALTGRSIAEARPLLAELTRESLLAEHRPGRYTTHDLLRAYALDSARAVDAEPVRQAALARVLDHGVHTAYAAARLLCPDRDPPAVPLPPAGAGVEPLADERAAMAWLTAEHRSLIGLLDGRVGADSHAWLLAWSVDPFLRRRADWAASSHTWRVAGAAAERLGHRSAQAYASRMLAKTWKRLGRFAEARTRLERALNLYEQDGDLIGAAGTWLALADHTHQEEGGRPAEALAQGIRALALYRAGAHHRGEAKALNSIGWYQILLDQPAAALTSCTRALDLQRLLGDREGEAYTCDSLGYAHHQLGRPTAAVAHYRRALDLFRELQDRYNEADTLVRLGDALHSAGDPAARSTWEQGLAIFDALGLREAADVRARLTPAVP